MLTGPTVLGVFGALLCASALGVILQRKIAEQHRVKRLAITFASSFRYS
jgi:hypothetical protein